MKGGFVVPEVVQSLTPFVEAGVLGPTDVHSVAAFARAGGEHRHEVLLAAALAVRAPSHGHVCIDLSTVREVVVGAGESAPEVQTDDTDTAEPSTEQDDAELDPQAVLLGALEWPEPIAWMTAVLDSPLVRQAGDGPRPDGRLVPFVVDNGRIYLARFWALERYVAGDMRHRSEVGDAPGLWSPSAVAATEQKITELFNDADPSQRDAALAAARFNFVVVAGGPGTGKTYTVARLLAAVMTGLEESGADLQIALAAPTGKASARMTEAVRQALAPAEGGTALPVTDGVRERLAGLEATTIHRLLGRGRDAGFRHGPESPLPHDVVVVDEVSMVSLSLMAHLLAAVRPDAKVVLVGDPYQLASVEAGTVLGDVVGVAGAGGEEPAPPAAIAPSVRRLSVPRRFGKGSGIKALADAVRACDGDSAIEVLTDTGQFPDLSWELPDGPGRAKVDAKVQERAVQIVTAAKAAVDLTGTAQSDAVAAVLQQMVELKVLSALRRGREGVDGWNRRVEEQLRNKDLKRYDDWYTGRPVMVTANDYLNSVFNGDVGVAVRNGDRYQVWFPRADGPQIVEASRLDRVATQWAMSIHKSQGSEFGHVVITLPPPPSRILTRELLYTAVTRAKKEVTIVATEDAIRFAVERPVARASGLAARLADG